jgi:hypothetical protein
MPCAGRLPSAKRTLSRRAKDDGVLIELGYLSPINYERRHEEQRSIS